MASIEIELLTRLVRTGDYTEAKKFNISPDDFGMVANKLMFEFLISEQKKGTIVGPDIFARTFTTFVEAGDNVTTTDYLCQQLREARVRRSLQQVIDVMRVPANVGILAPLKHAAVEIQRLLELATAKNTDMSLGATMKETVRLYDLQKNGVELACMSWPWPVLNDITGGIQSEDYIVLYGRPKSMKSWVLSYLIAHVFQEEKVAVVYTKEMTQHNLGKRVSACIAKLPYDELRSAKLCTEEENALRDLAVMSHEPYNPGQVHFLDGGSQGGQDTVAWLEARAKFYKADIVLVDGMYLMADNTKGVRADHERVRNISRDLRSMGLRLGIPVVITIQANRKAAGHSAGNLDEVAFSDAVSQDATVVFRVINRDKVGLITLVAAGAREYALSGININAVVARDFSFHSVLDEAEAQKIQENDAKEAAAEEIATQKALEKLEKAKAKANGGGALLDMSSIKREVPS